MVNLRKFLRSKILNELYANSESTHYDKVNNRKVKIFDDTIDYIKNTVRAEITSGKQKGLFAIVNLDNLVELNPSKMVAENLDNYPLGSQNDRMAPWNQSNNKVEIANYTFDDQNEVFHINLSNGENFDMDYIDVWNTINQNNNPLLPQDNLTAMIRQLETEGFNFNDIFSEEAEKLRLINNDDDKYDEFGDDDFEFNRDNF
mgnify:FL=1